MQTSDFPNFPEPGVIHVWRICLDRDWDIPQFLTSEEADRQSRYKLSAHGDRFARSRRALRFLLGSYLDLDPELIQFKAGSNGKPHLKRSLSDQSLYFNVSHSHQTTLVAIGTEHHLGVDVEINREIPDEPEIVRRFFSKREIATYHDLPAHLRSNGFFKAWTRKEAILKASGMGLKVPLNSFSVSLDPRKPSKIHHLPTTWEEKKSWSLIDISADPIFTAALAIKTKISRIEHLNFGDPKSESNNLTYSN